MPVLALELLIELHVCLCAMCNNEMSKLVKSKL
jgi:hypothetical protein